jgi:RNA recognition motif-containing protein
MGDNQSRSCDVPGQSNPPGTECEVLTYLVRVLNQRPEKSLLLSDLGALLPDPLRVAIKENGGLRTCVQKFSIFKVSGQPGRERVTLLLGAEQNALIPEVARGTSAAPSEPAPEPNPSRECDDDDCDETDHSTVQLRGLPYRATEADVRKFLGPHGMHLKDESSIQMLLSRDGRPSGFAHVQFSCPTIARAACEDLHERVMQIDVDNLSGASSSSRHRYVEVFLHSEHPGKVRFKKRSPISGFQEDVDPALEEEAARISPNHIANEVRQYMAQDGKSELLLSMLGVALSAAARLYLRKSDRGVKSFLAQYPNEFVISGEKGRERITFMPNGVPTQVMPTQVMQTQVVPTQECQLMNAFPFGTTSASKAIESNPQAESITQPDADYFDAPPSKTPQIWGSPDVDDCSGGLGKPAMSPSFFQTPSCWGTPDVNQGSRPADKLADIFPEDPGQLMQSLWAPFPLSFNPPPPPDPRSSSNAVRPLETEAATPMVRLRGLPFDTSKQEVCSFFSHKGLSDRIAEGGASIQILTKPNGKPSGCATVELRRAEDIAVVQKVLHMAHFGARYVEVFPHLQPSNPPLRQDSADQVQLNSMQLAPQVMPPQMMAPQMMAPQVMAGSTMYSDAWLLSQFAVTVAQCSPEHNSYNTGLNLLPGQACRQDQGLRV